MECCVAVLVAVVVDGVVAGCIVDWLCAVMVLLVVDGVVVACCSAARPSVVWPLVAAEVAGVVAACAVVVFSVVAAGVVVC
jgi:hypothetical protein